MRELFRPIERAAGYFVSNRGRVFSNRSEKILARGVRTKGYEQLDFSLGTGKKNYLILCTHVLVAEAFLGPRPSSNHVCNHKDGNKRNNDVENLEWVTKAEDRRHADRLGLIKPCDQSGDRAPGAKLTWRDVRMIRSLRPTNRQETLAKRFGVSQTAISKICLQKRWRENEATT